MAKALHIDGLRQFQRDLKTVDRELAKELRKALNISAEVVVGAARPLVPTLTGRAKKTYKARSTQKEARVVAGGKRAPYVPWLEFGGRVGRNKSIERRQVAGGRYLYPSLSREHDEVYRVMRGALIELVERAGIGVTDG